MAKRHVNDLPNMSPPISDQREIAEKSICWSRAGVLTYFSKPHSNDAIQSNKPHEKVCLPWASSTTEMDTYSDFWQLRVDANLSPVVPSMRKQLALSGMCVSDCAISTYGRPAKTDQLNPIAVLLSLDNPSYCRPMNFEERLSQRYK